MKSYCVKQKKQNENEEERKAAITASKTKNMLNKDWFCDINM